MSLPTVPLSYLTLNGLSVAYAVIGTGDPLLLLHGWGAHSGLVWALAEQMSQRGYCVHVLDLPAFGKSEAPPHVWTVFDYANLIIDYLNVQGLERVFLFGHSFGGRLGLILGAEHSQRLYKMALADSAGLRPRVPFWVQMRTRLYKRIRDTLYTVGLSRWADTLRQRYNARYASSDFNATDGTLRQTFINVINQDLSDYAKRATPPTLLFWGDKDEDTPLWMGQTLEKIMPDAGLIIHKGAGHYSYLERLDETVRVMDYFFKQS